MRSLRKLALVGVAALLVCAAMASSAFAVTAKDAGGTALSAGDTVSATATGVKLSGSFFFVSTTVTCDSDVQGTVLANPSGGGHVWGTIDSLSFTNCNSTSGGSCNVSVSGLPFDQSDGGGLEAVSTSSVRLGTGNASTNYIDVSDCMPFNSTCQLKGGTAGPATDGSYSLSNYVTAGWSNAATNQLSLNTSVGVKSCTATSTNWNGGYRLTEDAGGTKVQLQ